MPRTSSSSHLSGNYITLNRQIFSRFCNLWQEMNSLLINGVIQNPNVSTRASTGSTTRRYRRRGTSTGKVTTMRKAA